MTDMNTINNNYLWILKQLFLKRNPSKCWEHSLLNGKNNYYEQQTGIQRTIMKDTTNINAENNHLWTTWILRTIMMQETLRSGIIYVD